MEYEPILALFQGLSLYRTVYRIRIRIRVKFRIRIRSNKNQNPEPHQGDKSNPDPHQRVADPQHWICVGPLKVPKREIFDSSDFPDFYTIKSSWVSDFLVKILTYFFNF